MDDSLFLDLGEEAVGALAELQQAKSNLCACQKKLVLLLFYKHQTGCYDHQYQSAPKVYAKRMRLFKKFGLRRANKMSDRQRAYHLAYYYVRKHRKTKML